MEKTLWKSRTAVALAAALVVSGCGMMGIGEKPPLGGQVVTLAGSQEVPPVDTRAVGSANVAVHADHTIAVKVTVNGMTPTASHVHEGAPGVNGPVIVPLAKQGDNEFVSAPGAKLTDAQYEAYKAGRLYVNVHSAAHPGGEIRGQVRAP
jgi:hypothetical protein